MLNQPAMLVLADGQVMEGISIGAEGSSVGELVFNTSMTGYQEILSDPSYNRQIITLTCAHVGNTGCNEDDLESSRIWAAGLVVRNYTEQPSNYRSQLTLSDWLKKHNVVAISGIDTRELTHILREKGAQSACITTETGDYKRALKAAQAFKGLQNLDLAIDVSRQTQERWHSGQGIWAQSSSPQKYHVVAYDFGIKHNILRILHDLGCHVTLVSAKTSVEEVLSLRPDGVFLSNGPGDPSACDYAISSVNYFLEANIPVFGICLGFQILALALNAKTIKMKLGHHGANHPVIEEGSARKVYITSQNHGFAVDESTLPDCLEVSHRSLFDNTVQGIKHVSKPAYGFQGHPEASPGPHDIETIFTPFIAMMGKNNIKKRDSLE